MSLDSISTQQNTDEVEYRNRIEAMFRNSANAYLEADQKFRQITRFDTGSRGIGMEGHSSRSWYGKFVEHHDRYNQETKESLDKLERIPAGDIFFTESVLAITKALQQLDTEKEKTDYISDFESITPDEPYFINEVLLPILKIIEDKTTDSLRVKMSDSLLDILTKNYKDYREYDPAAMEILKTLVIISEETGLEKIIDFTKEECGPDYKITDQETITEQILRGIEEIEWQISERESIYLEQGQSPDPNDEVLLDAIERLNNLRHVLEDEDELSNVVEMYQPSYDKGILELEHNPSRVIHQGICEAILLREINNEEETKMLSIFLSKTLTFNSSGSLGEYAKAFAFLGADLSFPYLIENLGSQDVLTRRMSAEILYNLEAREKTIDSPEGIEYFNKMYLLVSEEDPDFFVRMYEKRAKVMRLSREKISVIDETGIVGFFQLELESKGTSVVADVHKLRAKDVFLPKADETSDDRLLREILMHKYLENYIDTQEDIYKETGIELNSLELHEQGWFVTFWSDEKTPTEQKARVAKLARKYGTEGIKSFLTLDYGGSAGEVINFLESSEIAEVDKQEILRNYARMLDRSMEWRKVFSEVEQGRNLNFSSEIHEAMIRKSSEYFQAAINISQNKESEVTMPELIKSLEEISFTLEKLKGLYVENSNLKLFQTQYHEGYREKGNESSKNPRASETWNFVDITDGSTVSVTVRLEQVYDGNGEKFERRVNFKVKNKMRKMEGRIGIDMDTYPMKVGQSDREMLSLDLATGKTDFKNRIHGTVSVTRILRGVEGGEGGHTYASFSKESAERYGEIAASFRDYMLKRFGWKMSWREKGEMARMART